MKPRKHPKAKKEFHPTRRAKKKIAVPRTTDDFFAQSEEFQIDWEQTLRVIAKMRADGLSLKKAAKQEGVNPRTVSRLGGRALRKRSNGSYVVARRDSLLRVMKVETPKGAVEVAIRSSREASLLGQYWDALEKDWRGNQSALTKFKGKFIKDSNGNKHPLITDRDELQRLRSACVLSFESLYGRSD